MQKISGILNEVGFAAFAKIQDDREKVAENYKKAMSILAFISFPIFWGMASVAGDLTMTVLGDKWMAVVLPLQLIAFITPLQIIFNTTTPALLGIGRADTFFFNLLFLNIIMPGAILIGTRWGVNGVAIAWALAYPPLFLLVQGRSLKQLAVRARDLTMAIYKSVGVAMIMLIIVVGNDLWLMGDRLPVIYSLVLSIGLGAIIYVGGSFRFNLAISLEAKRLIFK